MKSPERYPRRKRVPWRRLGSEALVVDVRGGLLFPLNSVGARIWELSDGQRNVDDIVDAIAAEFEADETTIRQDTTEFLHALHQRELISLEDAPHPLAAE
jgi:hypothetical protein